MDLDFLHSRTLSSLPDALLQERIAAYREAFQELSGASAEGGQSMRQQLAEALQLLEDERLRRSRRAS